MHFLLMNLSEDAIIYKLTCIYLPVIFAIKKHKGLAN